MAQEHLDRLTSVDAGFLHNEDGRDSHMHIGGIAILEGPAPSPEQLTAHVESRLHMLPRYRQKLAFPPLGSGRPLWVDDPSFRLEYHVRHTGLPGPGSERELLNLVSRIISQRMDRHRPLWELYLVEGLQDGRVALINKTHHALLDGVGGVDLMTALLDVSPETRETGYHPFTPRPTPSGLGLLAHGVRGAVRNAVSLTGGAVQAALHPTETLHKAVDIADGLAEVASSLINAAPATPLNVTPGPHRRMALVRERLEDFKLVKAAFGGTVNDVILTAVAGGLATFLTERGFTPTERLRACVPVSTRTDEKRGAMGNEITIMVAPLPVDVADPVERLAEVRRAMQGLKESKQALGAKVLTQVENFAPPTILAQATKLSFSPRLYNLLVTNVPGPQFPVYLLGRRIHEVFPIAFLAPTHALAIAIISYDGGVNIGLLADFDHLPDVDRLAAAIDESLAELLGRARVELGEKPPGKSVRRNRPMKTANKGARRAAAAAPDEPVQATAAGTPTQPIGTGRRATRSRTDGPSAREALAPRKPTVKKPARPPSSTAGSESTGAAATRR